MSRRWEERLLSDVCQVVNGGTPRTAVAEYWGGPHAWITPAEMGRLPSPGVSSTERTLSDLGLANSSARLIPSNSVILSTRAPIGHVVINEVPMAFNQGCRGLVPGPRLLAKYLYYFLVHSTPVLEGLGTGTTFKELSAGRLKGVRIPVPPLAEQERIIDLLDTTMAEVAFAQATTRESLSYVHDLFRARVSEVIDAEDQDRTRTTLGDVCHRFEYGSSAKSQVSGSTPVLRMGNVQDGEIDWTSLVFTSDAEEIARFRLRPGDVLFNRTNSPDLVGKSAIYRRDTGETVFAGYLIRLHYDPERVDPEYLNFYLNAASTREYGRTVMGKSVNQANISASKLRDYPISLPPLKQQEELAAGLLELKQLVRDLRVVASARLGALHELQASLLHQALSGQL